MPKVYKAKILLTFFLKEGFLKIGQKWSHLKLQNSKWNIIILPIHNKDIPYWTFRAIVEQSWLDLDYIVSNL
jgi:predicted RNA binding protein YcfA (HicA-like mRNA interferase family)